MLGQIEAPEIGRHSHSLDADMSVALGTSLTNPHDAENCFATSAPNLDDITFTQFEVLQSAESTAISGNVDGVR
jgi:hypothetical protein